MTTHTPGPWYIGERRENDNTLEICKAYPNPAKYDCVALVEPRPHYADNQYSNAHLIAAAPDLLAELVRLVRSLEPREQDGSLAVPGLATLNGARAAIAKATQGEGT